MEKVKTKQNKANPTGEMAASECKQRQVLAR